MKFYYKFIIILFIFPCILYSEELDVYYIDKPPYYYTSSEGLPSGFLLKITQMILDNAGIEYTIQEAPAKRVLQILKNKENTLSPGWYKTIDRSEEYIYSDSIYQDSPSLIILSRDLYKDQKEISFEEILASGLKLVLVDGYSYGKWYDNHLQNYASNIEYLNTVTMNIIMMISRNRADWTLVNAEETMWLFEYYPHIAEDVRSISIQDSPRGNHRYLIFNPQVNEEIISRINVSIEEIKRSEEYINTISLYEK